MQIQFEQKIGAGGFGDVWRAQDEIGRVVAAKIIRPDDPLGAQALAHARALAPLDHPNIVRVYTVERAPDPENSGNTVSVILMEYIEGQTIGARLREAPFPRSEAQRIGQEIISGLGHMIERRIAHGDLHSENIMLCTSGVKIIDVLYLSGAGQLSTASFDGRVRRDLLSLRLLLQEILQNSEYGTGVSKKFNNSLGLTPSLDEIEGAFKDVVSLSHQSDVGAAIDGALDRVRDPGFVAGPEYAFAVAQEIPLEGYSAVLLRILDERLCRSKHADLASLLWRSIPNAERSGLITELAKQLDANVPGGTWAHAMQLLKALGRDGWEALPAACRIRLESHIINDTMNGYFDIHSATRLKGGALGTWANALHVFFTKRDSLVQNLASLLRQSWYTQNYVAQHFMLSLPRMCDTEAQRTLLVEGLASAIRNDARIVGLNLKLLPEDWQRDAKALASAVS